PVNNTKRITIIHFSNPNYQECVCLGTGETRKPGHSTFSEHLVRTRRWVTKGSRSQTIDWHQSPQAHGNYKWTTPSHDHSDGPEPTRRTFDQQAKVPRSCVRFV